MEHQLDAVKLLGKLLGFAFLARGTAQSRRFHLFNNAFVGGISLDGELARQQVIAAVALGDSHHIAAIAQLGNVLFKYHFHDCSETFRVLSFEWCVCESYSKLETRNS